MATYRPTAYDIAWTKRLWRHLNVGGIWSYKDKPIVVRKDSEGDATLMSFKTDTEEVERLSAVMGACGINTVEASIGDSYGLWN